MRTLSTITTEATHGLLTAIEQQGLDPVAVASRVGLSQSHLFSSDVALPLATFTTMLEVVAADRGDGAFGLKLGKTFSFESLGALGMVMLTAPSLGEALSKFTTYFPCLQSHTRSTLSTNGGIARLAYRIEDPTIYFRVQDAMFTLAIESAIIKKLLGHRGQFGFVDFAHAPEIDPDVWRDHFRCEVRFNASDNAICFPAHLLDQPIHGADSARNSSMEQALAYSLKSQRSRLDLVSSLELWMKARMARSTSIDIEDAAGDFGMSLRSFQRDLSAYGINYTAVRNRVRSQIATCMLLETNVPVTAIAFYLGYSETSAFSRAYRHQTGMSPNTVRKRRRLMAGSPQHASHASH